MKTACFLLERIRHNYTCQSNLADCQGLQARGYNSSFSPQGSNEMYSKTSMWDLTRGTECLKNEEISWPQRLMLSIFIMISTTWVLTSYFCSVRWVFPYEMRVNVFVMSFLQNFILLFFFFPNETRLYREFPSVWCECFSLSSLPPLASLFHINRLSLLQSTYLHGEQFLRESLAFQHLALSKLKIVLFLKRKGYPIKSNCLRGGMDAQFFQEK